MVDVLYGTMQVFGIMAISAGAVAIGYFVYAIIKNIQEK
jgi:hypothetical protein